MKLILCLSALALVAALNKYQYGQGKHDHKRYTYPEVKKTRRSDENFDQQCPVTCEWSKGRVRVEHHHHAGVFSAAKHHQDAKDGSDNLGLALSTAANAVDNIYHRCYHRDSSVSFIADATHLDGVKINGGKTGTRTCQCQCAQWQCGDSGPECHFGGLQIPDGKCIGTKPECRPQGIESGMVNQWTSSNNNDWKTITFAQTYTDPVVIAGTPSYEGGDSISIVVKDVTSTGFKMKMHEPDCYDGQHPAAEHVGWMVAERGLHVVDGVKMLFDTTTVSGSGWNPVNFEGFSSTPNVITTLTNDATKFAYLRHQGLTSSYFEIHLDGSSSSDHNYKSNEASYVVIERTSGSNDGKNFAAGHSTGHTESSKQISLPTSMSNSNYAIFTGVTMNGGDAGNIRFHYSGKNSNKFTVGFDEAETCGWDGPHPAHEDVYWLALDTGVLENTV